MTKITIEGNITGDVQLAFSRSGDACANFNVAVNHRKKDGNEWVDDGATFYRVSAWRKLGENCADSLSKGVAVIVTGDVRNREYEHNGEQRRSLEITADNVGPSLRWASAKVARTEPNPAGGGGRGAGWGQGQPQGQPQGGGTAAGRDPWAQPDDSTPPF